MKSKQTRRAANLIGPWHTKIDSHWRITIPKPIRDKFGLRAGDTVTFTQLDDEKIALRFFRELKDGRWLDLIARKVVRRLPGWHDQSLMMKSPGLESTRQAVRSTATNAGASIDQRVEDRAHATVCFDRVPGEILLHDFVRPFGLSAKMIARAVYRDRKE